MRKAIEQWPKDFYRDVRHLTIWCSNFNPKTTHEELAEFFTSKGFKPVEVNIIATRKSEQLIRPYAFLHFACQPTHQLPLPSVPLLYVKPFRFPTSDPSDRTEAYLMADFAMTRYSPVCVSLAV
jgi:hypothetical protein